MKQREKCSGRGFETRQVHQKKIEHGVQRALRV